MMLFYPTLARTDGRRNGFLCPLSLDTAPPCCQSRTVCGLPSHVTWPLGFVSRKDVCCLHFVSDSLLGESLIAVTPEARIAAG